MKGLCCCQFVNSNGNEWCVSVLGLGDGRPIAAGCDMSVAGQAAVCFEICQGVMASFSASAGTVIC